ncbi:hypothetical protein ACQCN2_00430 [Brevibacillus ginsengisoli]
MNPQPMKRKTIKEYITGLTVWGKIGWVIVLGYIVGRLIYWVSKL